MQAVAWPQPILNKTQDLAMRTTSQRVQISSPHSHFMPRASISTDLYTLFSKRRLQW